MSQRDREGEREKEREREECLGVYSVLLRVRVMVGCEAAYLGKELWKERWG